MEEYSRNQLAELPDYKEVVRRYTKHWIWFALAIALGISCSYVYLRYATKKYAAKAKIQILPERGAGQELNIFNEMDLLTGEENVVEDEIEIINSRSNFIEVVNRLKTNIRIVHLGNIKNSEIYPNSPIQLNFISPDSVINNKEIDFYVELDTEATFRYRGSENGSPQTIAYGKNVVTPLGEVVITPNSEYFKQFKGENLRIEVRPVSRLAEEYREKVLIKPADKVSNVLNLSYNDPVQQKAIDILTELVNVYNENGIADRKAVADKTSNFIEERISSIYENLADVDESEEDLRTLRGLTNIESESNINLNVSASTQRELSNVNTQLNIAESMKGIVDNETDFGLLPSNIGLSDPTIANATTKYNQLIAERNRLLKSSNEKNPIIVNLDQEITGLKRIMQSSLEGMIDNLNLQASGLNQQQSRLNYRIYSAPKNQRALRDITRKQETTESLYLYLLQKREEAQIAYASSKPKSKVIDLAYAPSEFPTSPKPKIIYLGAVLFSVLIPFSTIFIHNLIDNKVHNRLSLEKLVGDIPVLGEVPKTKKQDQRSIKKHDRSALAESFRIIATNLDYVLQNGTNNKHNVVFITSSVPGEGKTFVSSNLSMTLAGIDSRVLLIGADIRNPQITNFFSDQNIYRSKKKPGTPGLTEYLYDKDVTVEDITHPVLVHTETIDLIYSGKIPPNPAELLRSARMEQLIEEVSRKYDYVILDTAPMMMVSDTLRISKFADHTIYVSKAGSTELKLLEYPIRLKREDKLNNLSFIVNGVKKSDLGYYGKYGYGYAQKKKKWFSF
ncbi:GumC family protein [Poritiphilus flavus]|uniref:non-specific protein-tyrosine kinase n=1 Tax=Poritiphilus flavus TaxID=2697053 RepID=A0A6L9EAM3_9FLAO|nr:tyrosine-protein kinase family protein [Poritiphilus flavus]NAS11509.1 polysaccharide biosynthesis tyrosine autokinase [Poritiphilus flavus]